MTRIAIFPAHADAAASSRIRAYTLQRSLSAMGHDARLFEAEGADVLFIQKHATPETLRVVRAAKGRGALVVYDVDDVGRTLWYSVAPSVLHELLGLVDVITTDTDGHRALLLRDYGVQTVRVLPDSIDYYPSGPVRPAVLPGDTPLRVLWFGNAANISLFARYAPVLATLPYVEVIVATNAASVGTLSRRFPRVAFVPWTRDGFIHLLQSCALTLLPHDGTENDRAKSNNRMIASINWGVPAVASRTTEYERTALEAGIEGALFRDEAGLLLAIDHLRSSAARLRYLDAAQPFVWQRYSPEAVASEFLGVVGQASRSAAPVRRGRYLAWLRRAAAGHVTAAIIHEARHVVAGWLGRNAFEVGR